MPVDGNKVFETVVFSGSTGGQADTDSKGQITKGGKPLSELMPSGIDFNVFQLRTMISF